ncbi:hypothetical protein EIKCOROL_00784 [Eikenella corrodens ATCC 23834]|uniref:Uncharacterized protein n=1 Tax=Eikenella corrodens ATCC 23834 TaxID=546274 RepID=C0DTV4_EIKCO|nr:hypothetical protein EIKCOROL_00784 [Eikenella corrodens ATCC 23834]
MLNIPILKTEKLKPAAENSGFRLFAAHAKQRRIYSGTLN